MSNYCSPFVTMTLTKLSILFLLVSPSFQFSIPWTLMKSSATKFVKNHAGGKDCAADLESLIQEASKLKRWAIQMVDATAKMPSGILNGNLNLFGDYNGCLSVDGNVNGRNIIGQYCSVFFAIDAASLRYFISGSILKKLLHNMEKINPIQILSRLNTNSTLLMSVGICVPKSCSIQNVDNLIWSLEKSLKLPSHVPMIEELCYYKDKPLEYKGVDIFIYCVFIAIFLIIMISTIYDVFLRSSGAPPNIVVCFSAYSNTKRVFSDDSASQNNLACLDGFKVISTFWVLIGHVGGNLAVVSKNQFYIFQEWKLRPINSPFWSAFYGVNTFFTISGLLVTYNYLRVSRNSSVGLFRFYWARFIRLTPALLATVFIHTSCFQIMADAPLAQLVSKTLSTGCHEKWWTVFFYFFNGMDHEQCAQHAWYIAVDSNMYLFAPLILFFINKYPKRVLGGMAVAFLVAVVYSVVTTVQRNLGFIPFECNLDFEHFLYYTVLYHMPSWLIGLFFGYLLHERKGKISGFYNLCLWFLALYVMLKLITSQLSFFHEEFNVYRAALWNGLARPTWSLALCFMILSCATGSGGFINRLLSLRIFTILRKFSYGIYLLHTPIMIMYFMNKRETNYFSSLEICFHFIGLAVITVICSIPFYLAFEAPVIAWMSLRKSDGEAKKQQEVDENIGKEKTS